MKDGLPKVRLRDFRAAAERIWWNSVTEPAVKNHSFLPDSAKDWSCEDCGVTLVELRPISLIWAKGGTYPSGPCTGNAYICRVARAIRKWFMGCHSNGMPLFTFGVRGFQSGRMSEIQPWDMSQAEFRRLLDQLMGVACNLWSTPVRNDTVNALVDAAEANPTVCPILADALEEAGCEDSALLQALRTP